MSRALLAIALISLGRGPGALADAPPRTAKPDLVVQSGHSMPLLAVAASPDGKLIATASEDRTVRIWDVATGKELRCLRGHGDKVRCVAFSPDGKTLASGCDDKIVRIWDLGGTKLRDLKGHTNLVSSLAFSADSRLLVSGSWDTTVRLWEASTGREIRQYKAQKAWIGSVAISADSKRVAAGDWNENAYIWSMASAQLLLTLKGHQDRVGAVAFSPDGKTLATGSLDKTVRLWNLAQPGAPRTLSGHTGEVLSVAFSADGSTVLTASLDGTARTWAVSSGAESGRFAGHFGGVTDAAFVSGGNRIVTSGVDLSARLWDGDTRKAIRFFVGLTNTVKQAMFSRDGSLIATASGDSTARLWTTAHDRAPLLLKGHEARVAAIALSPDGSRALTGSWDKTAILWAVGNGVPQTTLKQFGGRVLSVAFSADGARELTGCSDGKARIFDANGNLLLEVDTGAKTVSAVAFSPNRQSFATCGDDDLARMFDASTGKELATFKGHSSTVTSCAFSPDGSKLVTGSRDQTARIWDAATGQETKRLKGHDSFVTSVAFSPDGSLVLTGSDDATARLWSAETGDEMRRFVGHTSRVQSAAFSPDGRRVLTASDDDTARLWDTASGKLLCSLASFSNGGWAVVAPDGRFDASNGGHVDGLHWVLDGKPLYLESFFEGHYTPDLLGALLDATPMPQPVLDLQEPVPPPPEVSITSPKAGDTFDNSSVKVTVQAVDKGGGVSDIRLYDNGKLVGGGARELTLAPEDDALSRDYTVELAPGDNSLKAVAVNKKGVESAPSEIKVKCSAGSPAADLYLVAVGIDKYINPAFSLLYARSDAQAFADAIEERAQGLFAHVYKTTLFNSEATADDLEAALKKLAVSTRPNDAFIFFYSGHGVVQPDATGKDEYYLVMNDVTRLDQVAAKGLAGRRLRELTGASTGGIKAQKQLIVLDACHSGEVVESFKGMAQEQAVAQLARSSGTTILASSLSDQKSRESKEIKHGLFTYALLAGLNGAASTGGRVTVRSLDAYLNLALVDLGRKYTSAPQYPTSFSAGQDFPIALVGAALTWLVAHR